MFANDTEGNLDAGKTESDTDASASASGALVWGTQDQPRSIQLDGCTRITLAPFSEVQRRAMVQVDLGIKEASPMVYSFELTKGTLEVEVAKGKGPFHGVLVRAPRKVGAIVKIGRGTITSTDVETTVAARAGRDMMVSVAEHWRGLRVGWAFSVTPSEPLGHQHAILAAPTSEVERPIVLATDQASAVQRIRWKPIVGSTAYLVRLFRLSNSERLLVRELRTTDTQMSLEALDSGRYQAQVASVDPFELRSDFGAPVALRVVQAVLPEGAYATNEGFRLPAHQRVLLRDTEDLELTYGTSNTMFVAAPGSIGLHDGDAVIVRLREKASSRETRLSLEPLDLAIGLTLQPIRAVWPGVPVEVRVSARRRDGTPSPELDGLMPAVTVNAQPYAASWQRLAGELRTAIEKPPTEGPWVIRVVVTDRRGDVMVRDFLEVAKQRKAED